MEKVMFEDRLEGHEEVSHEGIWGKVFQAEGATSAKALRHNCVWHVEGTARSPE